MPNKKCSHGKVNNGYLCKECKKEGKGGKGICEHLFSRNSCKECKKTGKGGHLLCEHYNMRNVCKECKKTGKGGHLLCDHYTQRGTCKECKKAGKGGHLICEHDFKRSLCKDCKKTGNGGGSLCDKHYNEKRSCVECKKDGKIGSRFCEHKIVKETCKECKKLGNGGQRICEHDLMRNQCKECKKLGKGGGKICKHDLQRSQCTKCREELPIGECLTRYKHACVICGKKLQTLKRRLEKTCHSHSQEYKKRPEHYWQEHVLKQIQFKPSYIDQPLKSCDKLDVFRPDLCYLTKDIAFALEFDEESHSGYEVSCELKKTNNMKDLFPNRKLVLIRMNPHPNKDVPKEYKEMAQRTDFMLDLFSSVLENPVQYELSDKATNVFYLFYGKKGLKHIQAAEECEGVIIQDKFFTSN